MKHALRATMLGALALILAMGTPAWGEENSGSERVTFTKDVLPILQENCQNCHRPLGQNLAGMVAPMSLMTYAEVRPWAKSIARVVNSREMPPWDANKETHGHFRNERTISDEQIATITAWVEQRAPRGKPSDAPAPVVFPKTGWNLGEPDLIIDFPEPFFVGDDVEDLYHNVTVQLTKEQLPHNKWIKAIEFRPGSEVVHHIIGYSAAPGSDTSFIEEGEDLRGRTMLGGMAPGTEQADYQEGYGILLETESLVTFAMHYHKEAGPGTGKYDSSQIGVRFTDEEITHPVDITTIAHGAFEIPPGASNWRVGASRTFDEDTILLSMMPHLHLRGKAARYTAIYPDGTSEVLLWVSEYDFNWQTQYDYAEPRLLPAGTRIEMDLYYDNSAELAAEVGFDSTRAIRFGGPTTDEMDLAWITIAPAEPIDLSMNVENSPSENTGD